MIGKAFGPGGRFPPYWPSFVCNTTRERMNMDSTISAAGIANVSGNISDCLIGGKWKAFLVVCLIEDRRRLWIVCLIEN